jgi:hypothetical protein
MKEYSIPVMWESCKKYNVKAENLQEAITKALKEFIKEPDDNFLDNSLTIAGYVLDDYEEVLDMNKAFTKAFKELNEENK